MGMSQQSQGAPPPTREELTVPGSQGAAQSSSPWVDLCWLVSPEEILNFIAVGELQKRTQPSAVTRRRGRGAGGGRTSSEPNPLA